MDFFRQSEVRIRQVAIILWDKRQWCTMGDHDCSNCKVRELSVLSKLSESDMLEFERARRPAIFQKGEQIFSQGTTPKGLYCVSNGKVKITQNGIDGREQIIHLATSGDVMGYRAILGGDKYSCSAIAIESSHLCWIPRQVFLNAVNKNPELASRLLLLFSNELKDAENRITAIAQRPVRERLAQSLMLLRESYGVESDGRTINVAVTREEIANITGTTRETTIRVLTEFSTDKIISLRARKIAILDQDELRRIANLGG